MCEDIKQNYTISWEVVWKIQLVNSPVTVSLNEDLVASIKRWKRYLKLISKWTGMHAPVCWTLIALICSWHSNDYIPCLVLCLFNGTYVKMSKAIVRSIWNKYYSLCALILSVCVCLNYGTAKQGQCVLWFQFCTLMLSGPGTKQTFVFLHKGQS